MELVSCHAYGAYNFGVVTTFLESLWTPGVDGSQSAIRVVCENCNNKLMGASFLRVEGSLGWEGEHYFLLYGDGQNVSVVDVFTVSHPPTSDVRGKRKQCPDYL